LNTSSICPAENIQDTLRAGGVNQGVEPLPSKHEALSPNPSSTNTQTHAHTDTHTHAHTHTHTHTHTLNAIRQLPVGVEAEQAG
jgi:hypothetical protein